MALSLRRTMVTDVGPVLVGVDTSTGPAVITAAADEAASRDAALVLVHVGGCGPDVLTAAATRLRATHPDLRVSTELLDAEPAAALVRRSRGASLLVLGHRSRRRIGRGRPEPVALRVLGRTDAPVLVYRPVDATAGVAPSRPVLLAVPATGADAVVGVAFFEAAWRRVPLVAVRIHPPLGGPDAAHLLDGSLAAWSDKYPDVPVHRVVMESLDATVALTALTRTAQLAVVGSAPNGGTAGPLGSVAQTLVHRGGCPVVAVPTSDVAT